MPLHSVNGITLYYERTGTGPPLVLLHGLGSSTGDWSAQIEHFAAHYDVLALDLRGHGRSSKPPGPYSIPQFAADTAALLRHLALGPAHIVGLSMGGMVAFQLAVDAPECVRSLVVVNSSADLRLNTLRRRFIYHQRRLLVRLVGLRAVGRVLGTQLFPEPDQAALRQALADRIAANDKRAYLAAIDAIAGWSIADRLPDIAVPALIVAAEHDYTPVAVKEACVAQMLQAELAVLPGCRHAAPAGHPAAFNEAVEAFLRRVSERNG